MQIKTLRYQYEPKFKTLKTLNASKDVEPQELSFFAGGMETSTATWKSLQISQKANPSFTINLTSNRAGNFAFKLYFVISHERTYTYFIRLILISSYFLASVNVILYIQANFVGIIQILQVLAYLVFSIMVN